MYKQNSTLPGPLTSLSGLAKAIALPHEFAPQRFPSFPALERTAVMGFSVPTTWNSNVGTTAKFMLTRQAVYPFWADLYPSASTGWAYSATWPILPTQQESVFVVDDSISDAFVGTRAPTLTQTGANTATALTTHPILGYDQGTGPRPFIFVPFNASVHAYGLTNGLNVNASGSSSLAVEVWNSPGEIRMVNLIGVKQTNTAFYGEALFTANYLSFGTPAQASGGFWIRPKIYTTSSTQPMLGVAIIVNSAPVIVTSWSATAQPASNVSGAGVIAPIHLPVLTAPEFSTSPLPWYATRTTAASALLTNVTQVLNKAGTFLGGRISPNVVSPFEVSRSYLANLHPAEKQQLCAEEGFYTFCPPSTDLSNFWDYTAATGNLPNSVTAPPLYRLDNDALVNVIYFDDSVAATFSITVDWHIEFRTSSALWQLAVSTMPLEGLHQAQLLLHGVGYFFSNKWHLTLARILSKLKNVHPLLGLASGVANMLISSKPQKAPRATSLVTATGGDSRGRTKKRGPKPPPKSKAKQNKSNQRKPKK